MNIVEATEEYRLAMKQGQKEYKELLALGKDPYPAVLDKLLPDGIENIQEMGILEIPADRIVGVKSAGRIAAFSASFKPLLEVETEFAAKWVSLCTAHLGSEGIREPVLCYEYLGNFYVQEGNKRVSVLRHFGSPRITGTVRRVLPPVSDDPRIRAYREFLEFYKLTKLYDVQYRSPGCYAKLLARLGREPDQIWTERERKTFSAYYQYFKDAFYALGGAKIFLLPEEALLSWLNVYTFEDLGRMSTAELKKAMSAMWDEVVAASRPDAVSVRTAPADLKPGILNILRSSGTDQLNVAFVHQRDVTSSTWTQAHDEGRQYLEQMFQGRVRVRSYFRADTAEEAEAILNRAVAEGANVVFTTTPQLSRVTLKAAVKYPKVRFLNCSVNTRSPSVRSYYCRIYEAKFITGAIAGAVTQGNNIGYVGDYPIFGVPASINAFALGAQMTNPDAKVHLRWSCVAGSPVADFMKAGIQVTSNRDAPSSAGGDYGIYGTYQIDSHGSLVSLASPIWVWGKCYENIIRSMLLGTWSDEKDPTKAVNYWWGMDSGVIDVKLADNLPEGVRILARLLLREMRSGTMNPFLRRIVDQDGNVRNNGTVCFTPDQLLRMDWLVQNVVGQIPSFDQILPIARPTVRSLGVYRDDIPEQKGGTL